jgi:hypothetical protein
MPKIIYQQLGSQKERLIYTETIKDPLQVYLSVLQGLTIRPLHRTYRIGHLGLIGSLPTSEFPQKELDFPCRKPLYAMLGT